jgi:flagellar biosynthesis protein FliR
MPQLNVLALGFSLYALVMFGVLIISLGTIVWIFQDQVEPILNAVLETLRAAPRPL